MANDDSIEKTVGQSTHDGLQDKEHMPTDEAVTPSSPVSVAEGANSGSNDGDDSEDTAAPEYMRGWRLWIVTAGLWIGLFLSTLETTIVSTSLVSITNALDGFLLRDWIVTAYLLTYTGFLVIYAKFSDVYGRKTMLLIAIAFFTVFSALCGAATEILELILFRVFQGIGASGLYSMIMVIAPTMVPVAKYGKYMAVVATVFIIASVLGPIVGGVISQHSQWRWVFLLNIPGGVVSFALIMAFLPSSHEKNGLTLKQALRAKFARSNLARVDGLGMLLLLAWSVLLVFSLEEGGTKYPWKSPVIIVTLVLAIILAVVFAVWEVYTEKSSGSAREPVFPPEICRDRLLGVMLLTAFFVGFPFVSIMVNIPQRAQAVNGLNPTDAGLALLPLLLTSPLATALSGFLTGNVKVPPFYLVVLSSALQLVGVGLMCSLPVEVVDGHVPAAQYGYEAIMGVGFGMGLTTLLTFARVAVPEKHLAVMMGAITQVRVLGGTISLAICAAILNNHLKTNLKDILSPEQTTLLLDSLEAIRSLTPSEQYEVKKTFAEGYHSQNIFMTVMTGLGLISSLFLWERKPRTAV